MCIFFDILNNFGVGRAGNSVHSSFTHISAHKEKRVRLFGFVWFYSLSLGLASSFALIVI